MLALGLGALFAAVAALVIGLGLSQEKRRDTAQMVALVGRFGGGPLPESRGSFGERVLMPMWTSMGSLTKRLSGADVTHRLQRRLDLAGNSARWTVERVMACKGLGLLGLAAFGALFGHSSALLALTLAAAGGALGFFLPNVLLYNAGVKRQEIITKTLSNGLDLLVVSVQAGLGFDAALAQVARETEGPLASEFSRVLQEMQIGKSRLQALQGLGERTESPDVKRFVGAVVQADSLGVPIARVLHEQAKEMRSRRRQRAEVKAQQVAVKILFPLIFFILPSLFIVILGPGAMEIARTF